MNLAWLMTFLATILLSGSALWAQEADPVFLENAAMRLEFARWPAPYLVRLVRKASGTAVVSQPQEKNLFVVVLEKDGRQTRVESSRAKQSSASVEKVDGGARLTLRFSGFDGADLSVEVSGTCLDEDPLVRWSIRVRNASGERLVAVRFPVIVAVPAIGEPDDDFLVLPALPGTLIENPAKNWGRGQSAALRFPGTMSAQFVAFQDAAAGVYLAGMDAGSHPMALAVVKRAGGFVLEHEFTPLAGPGEDWESPYPVALGVTHGAWYDTADLYKDWAMRQPWCARTLAQRDDVPAWWKAGPAVHVCEVRSYDAKRTCCGSYYPKLVEHLLAFRAKIDGPVVPMLAGWENHRRWTAGDYFPVFDEENARKAIQQLRQHDFRPFFFLSGLYYTFENEGVDASRVPAAEQYLPHFVVDAATGKPRVFSLDESSRNGTWKRHSYAFCVADPATEAFFRRVIEQAHALGVDVLQMDQTVQGAGDACFSTQHGHTPGPGLYQTRAFQTLLDRLRQYGKSLAPEFVLLHEEPHEQLIPYLDGFHMREYYEREWYRSQPGAVGIPLFSYLYHEYAIGYGGDSARLNRGKDPWLVRCHAVNLVTGRTPGAAVWSSRQDALDAHPDQITMLRNHSRLLKTRAKDYLMLGKMLHPLKLEVPKLRYTLHVDRTEDAFEGPAVLTSSWQSVDGRVGHLLVNVSEAPQSLAFSLDSRNGPPFGRARVELFRSSRDGGFQPLWDDTPLPRQWAIELAPLEAVFVEIRPPLASGSGDRPFQGDRKRSSLSLDVPISSSASSLSM